LSPHQEGICLFDTAIKPPPVNGHIPAQGEHFLFEDIGCSRVNAFHLQIEMEGFPSHELDASGVLPHLFYLVDGFVGICNVKASNQIHLA
jgi:hypothetical protein